MGPKDLHSYPGFCTQLLCNFRKSWSPPRNPSSEELFLVEWALCRSPTQPPSSFHSILVHLLLLTVLSSVSHSRGYLLEDRVLPILIMVLVLARLTAGTQYLLNDWWGISTGSLSFFFLTRLKRRQYLWTLSSELFEEWYSVMRNQDGIRLLKSFESVWATTP